jgi:hypothetical protein
MSFSVFVQMRYREKLSRKQHLKTSPGISLVSEAKVLDPTEKFANLRKQGVEIFKATT